MQKTPGEGEPKWGWAPAILLIFVTFALGWASAGLIADLLGLGWIVWPLRIGFTAAEAMVMAWLFEPQKGYYTETQMQGLESAKWVVLCAGMIDGVLLIIIMKFGGGVGLSVAQAIVTLGAIFYSAGASMWVIANDPKRIAMIKETTADMKIFLRDVSLRMQVKEDEIMTKELELAANNRARIDLRNNTMKSLAGETAQDQLAHSGEELALGIVHRYSERVKKMVGVTNSRPAIVAPELSVGESRGASEPQQKRRILGITVPSFLAPSSGDGAPRRG